MNTTELLSTLESQGLRLILDASGGLRCYGDRTKVNALLPTIRAHKPEILAALTGKASMPDLVGQTYPFNPTDPDHLPAEQFANTIRAGWVWHRGEWFAPGTWKAKETPQEAHEAEPATYGHETPIHAATGNQGGGHVVCGDCQHYIPNRYGLGGIGNCAVLDEIPGGLGYPQVDRRCSSFMAITATQEGGAA